MMNYKCPQCRRIRTYHWFFLDDFELRICKLCFEANNARAEDRFQKELKKKKLSTVDSHFVQE